MNQASRNREQAYSTGTTSSRGYSTWEQVSGYFDGDGGIAIRIGLFTIQILVMWSDTDIEQVRHVALFLVSERIRPEGPYLRRGKGASRDAYNLVISEEGGALITLKRMLPFVDKKKAQVRAAIDYLEDKITADELIESMNVAIERGKRRAPRQPYLSRTSGIPYTKTEGHQKAAASAASKQKFKLRVRFDRGQIDQIRNDVLDKGKSIKEVAMLYRLSDSSVRRLVRGRH